MLTRSSVMPRNCIYLENVGSLLGSKMEMKKVIHFIIQELRFHVSLLKGQSVQNQNPWYSSQFYHILLRFCTSRCSNWQQEISKRKLVLRWANVTMQNVGFAATLLNALLVEK